MEQTPLWVEKKERHKRMRVMVQVAILLLLPAALIKALFFGVRYQPPLSAALQTTDTGFIALSYPGVDREGGHSLIAAERLEEHLRSLHNAGYVTVSQQDIIDYYDNGKPLPEKALLLMFENGRRDTVLLAQPLLERYNFRATVLSYAGNLNSGNPAFLQARDLKKLSGNSFWELGSNGYRLAYINVFDREGNFWDVLSPQKFQMAAPAPDNNYDHYLMDFIRDADGVPKETPAELRQRISLDYENMQRTYLDGLGKMPGLYAIMHANSGYFGTNEKAGQVNAEWIPRLFELCVNRAGSCLNIRPSGAYNLTRMQPSPYWYANHLLMRIAEDSDVETAFVSGDPERGRQWETLAGAAEFKDETIVLTTLPHGDGLLRWNGVLPDDVGVTVELGGEKLGGQSLYLRADGELQHYLAVSVIDNALAIAEKMADGQESVLYRLDLAQPGGSGIQSPPDNRPAHRRLEVRLAGEQLSVLVDGQPLAENLTVKTGGGGDIFLAATTSDQQQADDVYDGVFTNMTIYALQEGATGAIVYDNRNDIPARLAMAVGKSWNAVIYWFVKTL